MGNTDLYRPLHSFYLLKPENALRNIFLVSDGHINHKDVTMDTVHKNSQHTRVFTFGVSSVMNRHLLGALARVGAGAFEGFDSKAKSKWEGKVKSQIAKAGQPGLTSVAVSWQQEDGAPPPKQAPNQITALFSGSRMVVYGFVKNCSSATLTAEIGDQEIAALVTKSDRYVTKGKILHRLAAKAIIRDWEDGLLSPDGLNQQRMKMDLKGYVIKLSKEFCIVTSLTSFIAVEKREKDEEMTCAPDIYELLDEVRENVCSFLRLDITPNDFEAALDSDDESTSYSTDDTGEHEEEEKKGESDRKSPVPRQYAFFGAGGDDYEVISSSHDHDIPTANPEYCLMSQEKESPEDVYEAALGEVYGLLSDLEEDVYDDMYCNADSEVERSHSMEPSFMKSQWHIVSEGESIPSSLLVTEKMSMMSEEESDEEEEMGFGLFEDDHAADFIVEKQMKLSSEEDSKQDHPVTLLCADSLPSLSERSASPKTSFLPTTIEEDVSEAISCTIARPDKVATSVSPRPLGAGPPEVPLFDMMDLKSRGPPDHTSGMLKTYRHLSQFHPIELSEIQPPPAMAFTPGAAPSHQQQSAMAVTLGAPPQTQSAMAYTSEVPLPLPQQAANRSAISAPSARPPPPPPPRQMLDMAFTLSGPPPPPRAPSAGPPLPPQMLDMAFTSSGPPPPPRAPSAKPPPPPPMLGKDFTSSGPPRPPRAPSARPPLPPPMLGKDFTSSGPPRPPRAPSAKPPPPPPMLGKDFTSSGPPRPPRAPSAKPPPPPPMLGKDFTSSGPPRPPRAPSARPPLPPPMLDKAFTSSGPPPPPPVSLMAVTSSRPPSRSNFRLAGPPPPPPMPYKAFTSSGSSSPPMPQITFCKMSAKIPSSHKSYSSDDDDEYYRVHSLSKPSRPDPIPMSLDYDLDDVPKYKDEGKDGVVHFACSQVLEKCDSIPSPASILADETEVIVISEELTAQKASRTKKKKAMLSISKPLKKIDLEQSVSWRKCESPDFFRKMDQENDLLEADQKKPTEHAKKIPVGRKCHGMRVTESIERNTEELSFQRAGAYRTRSSGGSCCMGPRTATYENTRNGRALHVDGRWVQDKERPEELHGFLSKVKDKSGGKGRSLNDLTDREPDLADVGSKMPVIAKAAKKNLSKKEFDILKKIQNKLGGWTRDELEKDLYIDLSACIEVLNTAGLKSLGVKVAMEMENVLVTAFVVMWILKTLAPELFPLDTTTRNWSQTAVEIAAAVLEIYDHDRSLLDKAVQYCDQLERAHPGVAYILELGSNWFNVASKILGL
ncbi:protein mono-ADP-ribosyltransferase PARP4-like isoform X2 [Argopecten irradians]|uniref:protein mono-ADP-ribosyltransferase PARP4-like isoform X2 n=1 Tax=Argopecten irradians TaxID=31199 RepID=UPI00371DCF6D